MKRIERKERTERCKGKEKGWGKGWEGKGMERSEGMTKRMEGGKH